MTPDRRLILMGLAAGLAGCASGRGSIAPASPPTSGLDFAEWTDVAPEYLLFPGDEIEIDIPRRSIRLMAGDEEIAARMAAQQHFRPAARDRRIPASLRAYAKLVSSADKGAVRIVEEE